MNLAQYLKSKRLSPGEFAKRAGVASRATIHLYLKHERMPEAPIMEKIERATNGEVTYEDMAKSYCEANNRPSWSIVAPPKSKRVPTDLKPHLSPWENLKIKLSLEGRLKEEKGEFFLDGKRTRPIHIARMFGLAKC